MPITHEVPYEHQINEIACGAACMSMAFKVLGLPKTQEQIWSDVAKAEDGMPYLRHLCSYAIDQGLTAMGVRLRRCAGPVLDFCLNSHLEVILLQRWSMDPKSGHYTILVGIHDDLVCFHDPHPDVPDGQNKWVSRIELRQNMTSLPDSQMGIGRQMLVLGNSKDSCVIKCKTCNYSVTIISSLMDYLAENEQQYGYDVMCPNCNRSALLKG